VYELGRTCRPAPGEARIHLRFWLLPNGIPQSLAGVVGCGIRETRVLQRSPSVARCEVQRYQNAPIGFAPQGGPIAKVFGEIPAGRQVLAGKMRADSHLMRYAAWLGVSSLGAWAYAVLALRHGETINSAYILVAALCTYAIGYRFYSKWIAARVLVLNDQRATPCVVHDDGKDFVKTNP
jgi:Carbon starvation protein CstA